MKTKFNTTAVEVEAMTMKTRLLRLNSPDDLEILIDVHALLNAKDDSEDAYFRINDIAKAFGKDPQVFTSHRSVAEYVSVLINNSNSVLSTKLEHKNSLFSEETHKNQIVSPSEKAVFFPSLEEIKEMSKKELRVIFAKHTTKYVKRKTGRHNSGTWLHKKVFLRFARWLDVRLEVQMDELVTHVIKHSSDLKTDRKSTIALFHPLTDAIKSHWIPAQSDNGKKFAYSNLANLINKKVIGMTAKKYKIENNIEANATTRDTFPDDILEQIEAAEKDMWGHIVYGGVTEYEVLKVKILK